MRKIIVVLWLAALCGSSWAMQYPELGVCTGDNVRLREDPGTEGKVIGRADVGTQFIVLDEVYIDGQKWYEIDLPTKEGTAFIIARYVNGWYNNGDIPVGEVCAEVRLKFGITPEKTRALFGKPESAQGQDEFTRYKYPGLDIHFESGTLSYVEIRRRGYPLHGFEVGDDAGKLTSLGMPDDAIDAEGWTYESATGEQIFFSFGGGRNGETIIESITWSRPIGEG